MSYWLTVVVTYRFTTGSVRDRICEVDDARSEYRNGSEEEMSHSKGSARPSSTGSAKRPGEPHV